MSWMAKLYETYENVFKLNLPDESKLMPISHTLQNAHINVVIDEDGNFKRARVLEKTKIILPATEQSAGRTRGDAPHPLADKLRYVAENYVQFGGTKKSYFDSYKSQLQEWCESQFCNPKVKAVYLYIKKGHLIEDLIQSNIIYTDDNNMLLSCWSDKVGPVPLLFKVLPKKDGKIEQGDALVCWTVEIEDDLCSNTWEDKNLQESWISFEASLATKGGFCFITGSKVSLATNHPAKLRNTGDKAKLISSNDKNGYTYRGRFINDTQACGIGYEVTQKAHNVLRWLISRQGYRNGNQVIVAWAVSGKEVPSPMMDSYSLLEDIDLEELTITKDEEKTVKEKPVIDHGRNLGQQFALKLNNKIAGYHAQLDNHEKIMIMGLDSATQGRMSIVYYRESNATDFFERLKSWHLDFSWPLRFKKEVLQPNGEKSTSKITWLVSAPVPAIIAKAAYGQAVKDELKKKTLERLLPCIIEGAPLPKDLVDACVRKASNPSAYKNKERGLWRRNIGVACALYKGFHSGRNTIVNDRRNYQMSLERECNSRDYLYGRLLALAENIERLALDRADEKRITTAERLMQRFSSKPFTTWKNIDESLRPYRNRLRISKDAGLLHYLEKEIQKICDLFSHEDFLNDLPLTGEYLLGYYCQKNYKKPKNPEKIQ